MTHGSLFAAPVPGAPPVGMSATDGRLALSGIFGTTPQLVAGGGVSQSGSNMQFTIAQAVWQIADVTNAAASFFSPTDSTILTPANGPGTGSRKDLICVRAHNYENGDADSQAAVVLVPGTAGSPGVDPAVPAGYFKYAEIAVPTSAATASACTLTIYGNSTFAPPDIQCPTYAQLLLVTGVVGQCAIVTADSTASNNGLYRCTGANTWLAIGGGLQLIVPTAVSANGTGSIGIGATGKVAYTAAPKISIDWDTSKFQNFIIKNYVSTSSSAVNGAVKLRASATDIVTGYVDSVVQLPATAGALSNGVSIATNLQGVRVGGSHGASHTIELDGAGLPSYTFAAIKSIDEAVTEYGGGSLNAVTVVTGLTIDLTGSTNTGVVQIYGLPTGT